MTPYKEFWKANSLTEAWQKIVNETKENTKDSLETAELILKDVKGGGTALEIGAGVGRLMRFMSPFFEQVWGVDMSETMVNLSTEFLQDYHNCAVKLSNGYRLPVASDAFDFVYSYITFQHMPDLSWVRSNVVEIQRVLKPGGVCRVQTIKGVPFKGELGTGGFHGHFFEHEDDFLSEFTRTGLKATVSTTPAGVIWVTASKETHA